MMFQVNKHHISSLVGKNGSKPAPSLATSSTSADVLAEAMALGSFRVKGNTSLRGKRFRDSRAQRLGVIQA